MTDDPLDRLRAADPLRDRAVPSPTSDDAVAMRDRILAGSTHAPASPDRGSTTRRWVVGGAVLAAGAAAAAAVAVRTSPVADPTNVGCYAGPSVTASTVVISADGDNPVAQCRELWRSGDMDLDGPSPDEIPALVACALETGIGVFPAGSCDDVETSGGATATADAPSGGATSDAATTSGDPVEDATPDEPAGLPLPDVQSDDDAVRRAMQDINLAMLDECLTLDAAIDLAEETLAAYGLEGWTIGPRFGEHTDQTCAGFFPEPDEQAVWFTPEPARDGQTPGPR